MQCIVLVAARSMQCETCSVQCEACSVKPAVCHAGLSSSEAAAGFAGGQLGLARGLPPAKNLPLDDQGGLLPP